jgi:general secretion pathway protein K
MNSERGGALLIVLWLAAALGAIGISVATTVRAETDHTSNVADGLRAHYLATGSLERAVQWMKWGGTQRNPDGSARFWERNQPRMQMHYATGDVIVEMIPETAKLNVNRATVEELRTVLLALTGDRARAESIVEAILHYRTPLAQDEDGPLDRYYLSLGPTFQARHASLEEIEELLFVRGVTPELFYGNFIEDANGQLYARGGLRDCLSIWGTSGFVDANSAAPPTLQAVGLAPADVDAVVRRRTQKPFETEMELRNMGIQANRLRVGGNTMWTLRATARLRRPDGTPSDVVRSAAMVVKQWPDQTLHPSAVDVIRYYGDAWSEFQVTPQ